MTSWRCFFLNQRSKLTGESVSGPSPKWALVRQQRPKFPRSKASYSFSTSIYFFKSSPRPFIRMSTEPPWNAQKTNGAAFRIFSLVSEKTQFSCQKYEMTENSAVNLKSIEESTDFMRQPYHIRNQHKKLRRLGFNVAIFEHLRFFVFPACRRIRKIKRKSRKFKVLKKGYIEP